MADNFYGFDEAEEGEKGRDNLFLWTIFILLLIGVAAACWMGSFFVFGHPEDPRFYPWLIKIKKVPLPVRFEVTAAPPGEFLSAARLFERYGKFNRLELQNENGELLRNYLKNFKETKKLTPYIVGNFDIITAYELKKTDMFPTGLVALAQSVDYPQVLIEHLYTTPQGDVAAARTMLQTGSNITLKRTDDLSAVIHVEKAADGRLLFTVVPLLYDTKALKNGIGTFSQEPPQTLNMQGGVPITKPPELKDALNQYVAFKRSRPAPENTADTKMAATDREVVRLDNVEPGQKVPETGALPATAVSTPVPVPGKPTPRFVATMTPIPAVKPVSSPLSTPKTMALATPAATPPTLAMLNTPPPRPAPVPIPAAPPRTGDVPVVPPPAPTEEPQVSPSGVPLKPFIASAQGKGMLPQAPGATWRTYQPGRAPTAKTITPLEASSFAGTGELPEKLYLQGDFHVTASGGNRAIMRDRGARGDAANPSPLDGVRVIVNYPAGAVPPNENAVLNRDASRPFEILQVYKGADGQINLVVREIIAQP